MNSTPTITNPRQAACDVLRTIYKQGGHADQLMDRALSTGNLTGPDRSLFAELVFGVLRRQGTLDHILSQFLQQPLGKLDPLVLILLRLGLYQLAYLDRIPASAAVNETVNLTKRAAPRFSGLVNGVLRNFLRHQDTITYPDPVTSPAEYIAARHSHPLWLVQQWLDQLGTTEAELLAAAASTPPSLTLRVNTLKTTRPRLMEHMLASGIATTPCTFSPDGVLVEGRHHIASLPGFNEGWFAVQDEASQLAGLLVGARPGERVLDTCAAPGGKATHLAQIMENQGTLVALDIAAKKLNHIRETIQRLGITIITTGVANLLRPEELPQGSFDRILLDAPCSGLGVIRRNPEAKWRVTPDDVQRLAASQRMLLKHAASLLTPGGTLLYSTCSTTRVENEEVVLDFLSQHPEFVLEDLHDSLPDAGQVLTPQGMLRAWPHRHGMDGFFAARLRRLSG